jgi:nucleotide-binding universal stress UspA family protein
VSTCARCGERSSGTGRASRRAVASSRPKGANPGGGKNARLGLKRGYGDVVPTPDVDPAEPEPEASAVPSGRFEIAKDGISGLVVGFDGTVPSRDALAFAAGVARRNRARLTVVYVTPFSGLAGMSAGAMGALVEAADQTAEQLRAEVAPVLDELGIGWEFVHRRGDVPSELEATAEQKRADSIVVGRSSSRAHQVIGSVPIRLVRGARRMIAVVP